MAVFQDLQGVSIASSASQIVALLCLLSLCYLLPVIRWRSRTRGLPLPPGPKRLPLVGNLFNIPSRKAWITHKDNSALYGELLPS